MRRLVSVALVALVVGALFPFSAGAQTSSQTSGGSLPQDEPELRYVPGRVVVGFKSGTDVARVASETGFRTVRRLDINRSRVVAVPEGETVPGFVEELQSRSDVAWAEPDYIVDYREVPNDTRFSELWGLHNTGQTVKGTTGTTDADIDAPEAWDIETGEPGVIAAVVDDGVDVSHPDFAGRIHAGAYDFGDNDTDPSPNPGGFHGTHVAGTMAASGNDAFGVSGVARDVTLLPIKIEPSNGEGSLSTVADGLDYAGEQGAHVVNFSLGVSAIPNSWLQAIAENPNTLYVTAAGNFGYNNDVTPDTCNMWLINLVCVAASGQSDELTEFTQYGEVNVDLAAPGANVLSSVPYASVLSPADTADPANWTFGGTDTWEVEPFYDIGEDGLGEGNGPYEPNTDSWAQLIDPVNLVGVSECEVQWAMLLDTVANRAGVYVEASTDGVNWDPIYYNTGFVLELAGAPLTDYEGMPQVFLRWRFESDAHPNRNMYSGVLMAWNSVICEESLGAQLNFDYLDGTSMASPHVAGVAALLFSHDPTATVEQVRWALLNGIDVIPSHAGQTATEGRLNALLALQKLAEAPDDPYVDQLTNHDVFIDLFASSTGKKRKIRIEGTIMPADGHWACSVNAPLEVERKKRRGWKTVAEFRGDNAGFYFKKIKWRKGTYRVVSPEGHYDNLIYCNGGKSGKQKIR